MTKSRDLGNLAQTVAVNLPTALGSAGQTLAVNTGANGLEFADAATGGGGSLEAVASGALANGDLVVVNSDGTVSVVGENQSTQTISSGTRLLNPSGGSAKAYYVGTAYDSNSQKVIIAYSDWNNGRYGTAVVGTVTGTSISLGTAVVFEAADTRYISVAYDTNAQKVLISYQDFTNSGYGTAIVGSVSGTSVSFGTATVFESANTTYIASVYEPSHQATVIAFSDNGYNAFLGVVAATISGTSVSFGSTIHDTLQSSHKAIVYDTNAQRFVVAYKSSYDTKGYIEIFSLSGTTLTKALSSGRSTFYNSSLNRPSLAYDSAQQKVVIVYGNSFNAQGEAIVGTVSANSISYGSSVTFTSTNVLASTTAYDVTAQKISIAYATSPYGYYITGTVSGTSITFDTQTQVEAVYGGGMGYEGQSIVYDSGQKRIVFVYNEAGNSSNDYGNVRVVLNSGVNISNLDTDNYIGISNAAYSNGATATVQISGSVDDAQSGLTAGSKYYVQTDGSLSVTAGNPSVLAGTAVSSTKIIVKG